MRAVEDAIGRQVLHGGDLATNLIELGTVDEAKLAEVLAESFGLPVAPGLKLPAPPVAVLRIVPGELAARHVVFPLALEGRTLDLAVSEPLSSAVEDDLAFALDVSVRQHLAPLVRIRQAIAEYYGIPLDRRLLRLVARLEGRHDPSPSSMPPAMRPDMPVKLPRSVSIAAPTFGTGVLEAMTPERGEPRKTEPSAANTAVVATPPAAEVPAAEPTSAEAAPAAVIAAEPSTSAASSSEAPAPISSDTPSRRAPSSRNVKALALFVKRAIQSDATQISDKRVASPERRSRPPRRKGPMTAVVVERELSEATTSEEVLDALFAFAHQYFEYTALFVVHGEHAEGRDASGPGVERGHVVGMSVLLEQPSAFAVARDKKAPVLSRFESGSDAELLRDLGRGPRTPAHSILVLPLLVRGRAVAMILGDDGTADVSLSQLGDLTTIAGLVGPALERVAMLKKRRGEGATDKRESRPPRRVTHEPAVARGGALALARSLGGTTDAKPVEIPAEPPAPQVSPGAESVRDPGAEKRGVTPAQGSLAHALALAADGPTILRAPGDARAPIPSRTGTTLQFEPVVAPKRTSPLPERHTTQPGLAPVAPVEIMAMPDPTPEPAVAAEASVPVSEDELVIERASRAVDAFAPPKRRTPPAGVPPRIVARKLPQRPIPREEAGQEVTPHARLEHGASHSRHPDPRVEPDAEPRSQAPQSISNVKPMESARTPIPVMPSVIVDVNAEYNSLLQKVIEGGPHGSEAFAELVKNAEVTTPLVLARFPGPLRVDRHRARGELPAASQCGPVLEVVVALRRHALPFMTKRTTSPDTDVRFWATHVLGELRYPEAANVLMPRLFDDDVAVRRVARRSAAALVGAGEAGAPLLTGLDHMIRNPDQPVPHRVLAIETMGEIRTGALVQPLVAALRDNHEEVAEAARRALLIITRQDFGRDERKWQDWWQRHGAQHRIEWLIDALMHEQPAIRRAAGDELKALTKEYYGYYDDLPKKERERAQALYREWWERDGRSRF